MGGDNGSHQDVRRPDLPVKDEHGYELVEFTCWKCSRTSYIADTAAEFIVKRGKRLLCLPCSRPDAFRYFDDEESGTELVRPLTDREQHRRKKRSGDLEAEELNHLQMQLDSFGKRSKDLDVKIEEMVAEKNRIINVVIPNYRKRIFEKTKEVQAKASDVQREFQDKQDKVQSIKERIADLERQVKEARGE